MRARRNLGVGVVVAVGLLTGCADDGSDASQSGDGSVDQDVKAPPSSSAQLETWTSSGADEGSTEHVSIAAPPNSPCIMISVGKVGYAALWPRAAVRENDGVRLGDHLYRFGETVELRGRKYRGGQTTTACLTTGMWMVLEGS